MVRLVIRGILFFTAVGLFAEAFFLRMNREGEEEEIRRAMTPVAVFPFPAVSRREPAEAAIEIPAGREWKRFRDRWTSSGLILAWVEPSPRLPANGETIAVSGPDGDRDLPFSPGPPFAYLDPTTQLAGWILGRRLPATPGSRVIVRVLPDGEERRPGSLVVLPGMTAEENSARNLSLTGMRWREWSFTAVAVACLVGALFFGGPRRPDVPLGTTS